MNPSAPASPRTYVTLALFLFCAVLSPGAAAQDAAQNPPGSWVVLPGLQEPLKTTLIRAHDVRGTYGELTLARLDAVEWKAVRRLVPAAFLLGEVRADERLFLLDLGMDEQLVEHPAARVLLRTESLTLVGLPADGQVLPHELMPPRAHALHDGVAPVLTRRQRPAAGPSGAGGWLAPTYDPRIQAWVDAVDMTNLQNEVTYLSTTWTNRRSDQSGGFAAQNYLKGRFEAFGLTTTLHDFNSDADNVVAELPGVVDPDRVVIVGAHYDSVASGSVAPGADDNASGTAAVLEMARVLSGASFRYTVRFICFASEEFGLVGSDAYSGMMVSQGVDVIAMLNTDMNAYKAAGDAHDLDMITNDTTTWLTNDLIVISNLYVPGLPVVTGSLSGGTSDHRSFFYDGFPAAFYFEDATGYSPYIHTANDTVPLSANNFALSQDITRSVLAGLATLAEPIDMTISHTAIQTTADEWNPLEVRATVTSLIGSTPQTVTAYYDAGSGEVAVPMLPTGASDEWIGQLPPQPAGQTLAYRIQAEDDLGYLEDWPAGGGTTSVLFGLQDVFFFDDFESGAAGWTHGGTEDDWQLGAPQGKSTDPSSAYSGASVYGNDLGPAGFNGEYRSNAACWLRSPSIDASGKSGVHLRYARWLAVEDAVYDQAEVRVEGVTVWQNPVGSGSDHWLDNQWSLHDLDVSAQADDNSDVRLRFHLTSDSGLEFGGWNVDDVEMYTLQSGTKPELYRDAAFMSLAAGGTANLFLDFGAGDAGRRYLVLGGVSGTSPGSNLGGVHVDLNFDAVTSLLIRFAYLFGLTGTTDGSGQAVVTLNFPPGLSPGAAGLELAFAAVTFGPVDRASNPITILLVP